MWKILSATTTQNISSQVYMAFDPQHVYGFGGGSELAIPWDVLYGLGAGNVPVGCEIGVVASLCWDPEPSGELGGDVAPNNVSASLPVVDNFLRVTVDGDNDGSPDPGLRASVPGVESLRADCLLAAFPSPTRAGVQVPLVIAGRGQGTCRVRAEIFDIGGRLVTTVFDGTVPAGRHLLDWNGTNNAGEPAASGIYFLRAKADDALIGTVKIIRIR
jgi:hypothetical protein